MRSIMRFLGLAAVLAFGLFATGCGSSDGDDTSSSNASSAPSAQIGGKRTIGIMPSSLAGEFLATKIKQFQQIGDKLGWDVKVIDGAGDPQKMDQGIRTFVTQKVDAVFTMSLGGEEIAGGLEAAKAANIPVVAVGQAPTPGQEKNFAAVYADDGEAMGKIAGEYIAKNRRDIPTVGLRLTQNYSGDSFVIGILDVFKKEGLKFQDLRDSNLTDLVNSMTKNTEAIVQKNKGELTMVDFSDFGAPIMTGVLDRASRDDVTVITRYDNSSTLKLVRDKKKVLFVNTKNYTHGFDAITALLDLWVNEKPLPTKPNLSQPEGRVVTPDEVPASGSLYPFEKDLDAQLATWKSTFGGN